MSVRLFEPRWHWRNCRQLSLSVSLLVWPWHFGIQREEDVHDGSMSLGIGPLVFGLQYGIGNASSESALVSALSLSEVDAYIRAVRFEGRRLCEACNGEGCIEDLTGSYPCPDCDGIGSAQVRHE